MLADGASKMLTVQEYGKFAQDLFCVCWTQRSFCVFFLDKETSPGVQSSVCERVLGVQQVSGSVLEPYSGLLAVHPRDSRTFSSKSIFQDLKLLPLGFSHKWVSQLLVF